MGEDSLLLFTSKDPLQKVLTTCTYKWPKVARVFHNFLKKLICIAIEWSHIQSVDCIRLDSITKHPRQMGCAGKSLAVLMIYM